MEKNKRDNMNAIPKSIEGIFKDNPKMKIPIFQRDYSWKNDNWKELWNDIKIGFANDSKHYLGSIVLVENDNDVEIVDGQQRLDDITIAFSVIRKLFLMEKEETLANKVYSYIMGEDADGVEYAKLETETPKPYFQMRIQKREQNENILPNTDEEKRILNAYNYLKENYQEKTFYKK